MKKAVLRIAVTIAAMAAAAIVGPFLYALNPIFFLVWVAMCISGGWLLSRMWVLKIGEL